MTETYTNGTWTVKEGEDAAFVEKWTNFANWGRNVDEPERYMSFADWESFDAQKTWKSEPEFKERIGRVRNHCTEFQPLVYELITRIDS